MADFDQIPETAIAWIAAGKKAALATVIKTWGSAPRSIGAQLVICEDGEFAGSVSGGCVEGAVVLEAQDALADGRVRLLEYGVSDDEAFAVGLACGGTIRVMVEPIGTGQGPSVAEVQALVNARAKRQPIAWLVNTKTWARRITDGRDDPLSAEITSGFLTDKSAFAEDWFIGIHNPPLKMVLVGAVHIAQPLIPMAQMAGFDTTLVDPRDAFASDGRFPDVTICRDWPDEALHALGLDARTAVVTLTHDPKIDDPAIIAALNSDVFYLGCLGSRKTHAKRLTRLQNAGLTTAQTDLIHAPVGQDIGAKSPAEIAVAILAEVINALRHPVVG